VGCVVDVVVDVVVVVGGWRAEGCQHEQTRCAGV
jgi:hypothetical protein